MRTEQVASARLVTLATVRRLIPCATLEWIAHHAGFPASFRSKLNGERLWILAEVQSFASQNNHLLKQRSANATR
jgi:hypothetical protein